MYDHPDDIDELPEQKIWDLINVNIGAVTFLTHMIIPEMKKRRRGIIANISSASDLQPVPYQTIYAATKVRQTPSIIQSQCRTIPYYSYRFISVICEELHLGIALWIGAIQHLRAIGLAHVHRHQNGCLFIRPESRQHLHPRCQTILSIRCIHPWQNGWYNRLLVSWHTGNYPHHFPFIIRM